MSQNPPLFVAQITDTHLFADPHQEKKGVVTAQSLQSVLERIEQLQPQPDLLLLTGDLSQDETPESYQYLQSVVSPLAIPTYWIPGNHDDLLLMEQILNQSPIFPHKSFQQGGWQFILLNSTVPGCVYGELSRSSLEWLDVQLQNSNQLPTLIALHHPPLPVNSAWMDNISLQNSDELLTILDRYPQIRLVIFGHIHQEFERKRQGIHYLGTPSTGFQFAPNLQEFQLDNLPPGFRLFKLYPDGRWETQIKRVKPLNSNSKTLSYSDS
jgi:Icc protein